MHVLSVESISLRWDADQRAWITVIEWDTSALFFVGTVTGSKERSTTFVIEENEATVLKDILSYYSTTGEPIPSFPMTQYFILLIEQMMKRDWNVIVRLELKGRKIND